MYHCHIHFYLAGQPDGVFEIIKKIAPFDHFIHEFSGSDRLSAKLAGEADVILANLRDLDVKEAMQELISGKRKEAELIVLAGSEQMTMLEESLGEIRDVWLLPMSDAEVEFRFRRWLEAFKMSKDFWQTSHYLEATINNIPSLVWYKDKSGIHEKVNDSFCRTVNKTKEDVEGRGHAYIWNVEHDDPACIESENEVMKNKKTFVSEELVKTGDGTKLLTTYKSPLYDLDGSVMGTVGVAIDVTKEREYEEEIIQKNDTLETIFTNLDCGVMRHSLDGKKILSVNRAALKILGYESREELISEGFALVASSVVGEDKEKLKNRILELKQEGDSVSVEYRVQHKDGKILHIMGNVKLLMENGELIYQRFLLDYTEQKLQEKRNERRQMELIQALGIDYNFVCFFDLDTGKGFAIRNDGGAGEMFATSFSGELSFEKGMERYIDSFVDEEDRQMLRQMASCDWLKSKLAEKKMHYVNYRMRKDGEIKYYQIKAVRVNTEDGNCGTVIGFRSVDEEIRGEMEKKSLLEDALMQANRANKAKSVFLSNMSHDIRTPMNAIVGFTSLAINHIERREQVEEYLGKIMTSGNHLLSLINDVLDMARLEKGDLELELAPCNIRTSVKETEQMFRGRMEEKGLNFDVKTDQIEHDYVVCDSLRMKQIALNLLSNALEYTQRGGSVIYEVRQTGVDSHGYVCMEMRIRDTGVGMSEEFQKHIFGVFEREKSATQSGVQGTGLGLAITRKVILMHHGAVRLVSKEGEGSTFIVRIPLSYISGSRQLPTP